MKRFMFPVFCSMLIGSFVAGMATAASAGVEYVVTDILPSDALGGMAWGISNSGHVVGGYASVDRESPAFIWDSNNGFRTLSAPGMGDATAFGVNDQGIAVGQYHDAYGFAYACVWDSDGAFHDLGPGTLLAINNNGLAVSGGDIWDVSGNPFLVASFSGTAWGLNDLGQVVGEVTQESLQKAFVRDADGAIRILAGDSMDTSRAMAINGLGDVVGFYDPFVGGQTPSLWDRNGNRCDIGVLNGDSRGWATSINDSGTVVGASADFYGSHAFLWTQVDGLQALSGLGGSTSYARAINSSGAIAGYATNASGQYRAVVWTPVPEPSSTFALLFVIGGVARVARRIRPRNEGDEALL